MKNKGAYIYNLYFDIFILYPSSTIDDQQSILHLTKNIQQNKWNICTMDRGHYITYPNNALLLGKPLNLP